MPQTSYSIAQVRLPENKKIATSLKKISLIFASLQLVIFAVLLLGEVANSPIIKSLFFNDYPIPLHTGASLAFLSLTLLIPDDFLMPGKKYSTVNLIGIMLGILVLLLGFVHINYYFTFNNLGVDKIFYNHVGLYNQVSIIVGFNLLLAGTSVLFSRIRIKHHFHFVQFFALCMLVISSTTVLDHFYRQLTTVENSQIIHMPLNVAFLFFFASVAISLRWPTRGFIGMFTTASVSSLFALKILIINVFLIAIVGFFSLFGVWMGIYSYSEALTIFAILTMTLVTCLSWLNIKLLYRFELERFVMKEELVAHNVSLKFGNKELEEEIKKLMSSNKEYSDKLSIRNKFEEIIDQTP